MVQLLRNERRVYEDEQSANHPIYSMDEIASLLRKNEIIDLRLAWRHSSLSKRSVSLLERALKSNTSVKRVSIGWRISKLSLLSRLLKSIAKHTNLEGLRLCLDTCVSQQELLHLLESQHTLTTLDIQAVSILDRPRKQPAHIIDAIQTAFLRGYTPNLRILKLRDCQLDDTAAICLADLLHIRGGLATLDLRSNRKLTGRGCKILVQAPIMERLDLSLCDLDASDAKKIAQGISVRNWPIYEVRLAGNYRLGTSGCAALTEPACCNKMVRLEVSFSGKVPAAQRVLENLQHLEHSTALQHVVMKGSFCATNQMAMSLGQVLRSAAPLRSIQMNAEHYQKPMNKQQLSTIYDALQDNYNMEDLGICGERGNMTKRISTILRLNTVGRRVLLRSEKNNKDDDDNDDLYQVLERAGKEDLEVLFYMVRQSAGELRRSNGSVKNNNAG